MSERQQVDLTRLLANQHDRKRIEFHKWLTPEQFGERFGMNDGDLSKVSAWLNDFGFSNIQVARSRNVIRATATVTAAETAFGTSIHRYRLNGETFYGNTSDLMLPKMLQDVVLGVVGLNSFRPQPPLVKSRAVRANFTLGPGGPYAMSPADFAIIYDVAPLYASGIDGTGQTIAIPGQTDIDLTVVAAFRKAAGLTANDPHIVPVDAEDPGVHADDQRESYLDLEWAGGVAKNATILYVKSKNVFESLAYAIENNIAPVIPVTYGLCEGEWPPDALQAFNALFQQANAQGITVIAASGDLGAADCDNGFGMTNTTATVPQSGATVDFPASSPYVTAVGGTQFNETGGVYWNQFNGSDFASALSYIPESGWDETFPDGSVWASGGGVSAVFPKPVWQETLTPADSMRDVPDVALLASPHHDGYVMCGDVTQCTNGFANTSNQVYLGGGTSAAAPSFAGVIALLNQQTGTKQGNVNATLYSTASMDAEAFHDVEDGSNQVTCQRDGPGCVAPNTTVGFLAAKGYDLVTGLGSVDAYNLVRQWAGDFDLAATPGTLTVGGGASATVDVQITAVNNFKSSVTFTCTVSNALPNTTCSIPGTVAGSGTASLTITNNGAAETQIPSGSSGESGSALQISVVLVTVLLALSFMRQRKQLKLAYGMALIVSVGFMSSCGGGGGGQTSETISSATGTVTITASSGVISHTATVSVTVP